MNALSAPGADTQEGGSSTESSVLSKQRATPSIQGDGNRLDAAAFNAPSREASVPPVVNAAYGGAPSYYGSMQPHGSSAESSVVSKQRATPSLQGDANRLDPAAFNAPSREASASYYGECCLWRRTFLLWEHAIPALPHAIRSFLFPSLPAISQSCVGPFRNR
jgi:hypothetical protein